MNLSARERKLLVALAGVLAVVVVYFVFLRGDGGGEAVVPDLFPSPSVAAPSPAASPTVSPSFVVPVGARDPFKP